MDDDMEDEIIYELFTAHIHIIWRYLGVTSAGLVEFIMPGPGESFKTKIFQPGPFMFLMFLILVASVALQSSSHVIRHWLIKAPYLLGLNSVADSTFKKIGVVGLDLTNATENVTWEFSDGIVGVYGMQGRRGNMEDRFAVLQDVDVGGKKMSFFGVYDGHGGQFTAEYVKENLFRNTIEKIRQLRTQMNKADESKSKTSGGGSNVNRSNSKTGNTVTLKRSNNKGVCERPTMASEESKDQTKCGSDGVKSDKDASITDSTCSKDDNPENKNTEKDTPTKKASKESQKDSGSKKESQNEKEKDQTKTQTGSCVENLSSHSSETCTNDVPLKKDDTYTNVNLLKRNSVSRSSIGGGNNDTPTVTPSIDSQDTGYMDSFGNLNYTRLLTDQILAVDRQVVQMCKNHSDMSGTTAVIGILEGELLVIANVGDSRAVMGDTRGSAIPLSFDHKPNQLKERRRIKEAGGFINFTGVWRVAGVLATSRALGDYPLKEPRPLVTAEPDVLTFSLRDHKAQFVILATDGLWDVVSNEEAVAFIAPRLSQRDHGASCLVRHAYSLGSQDNITVAVLTLGHLAG